MPFTSNTVILPSRRFGRSYWTQGVSKREIAQFYCVQPELVRLFTHSPLVLHKQFTCRFLLYKVGMIVHHDIKPDDRRIKYRTFALRQSSTSQALSLSCIPLNLQLRSFLPRKKLSLHILQALGTGSSLASVSPWCTTTSSTFRTNVEHGNNLVSPYYYMASDFAHIYFCTAKFTAQCLMWPSVNQSPSHFLVLSQKWMKLWFLSPMRRLFSTNRNAGDARSSLEDDRPPSYSLIDTMAPMHTVSVDSPNDRAWNVSVGRGPASVMLPNETEPSLMNTLGFAETSDVAAPRYSKHPSGSSPTSHLYEFVSILPDLCWGRSPSNLKTPAAPGDPFLGRINAKYVPPPHTAKAVRRSISKVENLKDCTSTSLFLTPYSQSPIGDADEVTILNRTGPGSTPQEPLALVAKISDSERTVLESGGRGGFASAQVAERQEIRYRTSIQHSYSSFS